MSEKLFLPSLEISISSAITEEKEYLLVNLKVIKWKICCTKFLKEEVAIMFTPARDFLLETPWRIIIPNPNVNSHSL
jgi:hypothetical protein